MITLTTLTNAEYQALRYKIVSAVEAEEALPYIDDNGHPTIGPGFLLDGGSGQNAVRNAVYETFGFKFQNVTVQEISIEAGYMAELTSIFNEYWVGSSKHEPQFLLAIADVMQRRYIDTRLSFPRREHFVFDVALDAQGDNTEMKAALGLFINSPGMHEQRLNDKLSLASPLAESRERAALVSLVYHSRNNVSKEFADALRADDRTEAWYQLRYNPYWLVNADPDIRDGLYKRIFHAAAVFQLYDNIPGVQSEEAKQIYRMFSKHREDIQDFWQLKGGRNEAQLVALANTLYPSNVVQALSLELELAKTKVIEDLGVTYAILATLNPADFLSTSILLDPVDPTVNPNNKAKLVAREYDAFGAEIAVNNILIGEGGDDWLEGGKGNDILIGGEGYDTYVWMEGDGADRIIDSDKKGRILIGGESYNFSADTFLQVSANLWKSVGGNITLTHNSPWTLHTADGGTLDLGEDFVEGDFGVNLRDARTDPTYEL